MQMLAVSSPVSGNVLEHKAQQFTSVLLQKIISLGWESKRIHVPVAEGVKCYVTVHFYASMPYG